MPRFPHVVPALALLCASALAADDYPLGADSQPQAVPPGELKKGVLDTSKFFPGTTHDNQVYVPQHYDAAKPACLMVFDNLIAKKEMPVTVGVFVNPGTIKATQPGAKDGGHSGKHGAALLPDTLRWLWRDWPKD